MFAEIYRMFLIPELLDPPHCLRRELQLTRSNNAFDMMQLSYRSLNLAETELVQLFHFIRRRLNRVFVVRLSTGRYTLGPFHYAGS